MKDPKIGSVLSLTINPAHREPLKFVSKAKFVAGYGIDGDRHYTERKERAGYQVLVMDRETIDELDLSIGDTRENVTTSGIDIYSLEPGSRLAIGNEVVLHIAKACPPCSRMDEVRPGLMNQLDGKRGMLASVEQGGSVSLGDIVRVI